MCVCILRLAISWLMQINSTISQHKQKKSGNEHVNVIFSDGFLKDFYILTLLNFFLQDYLIRDIYSENLSLALPVQHGKRMYCIMLSYFSYLAVTYFYTFSDECSSFQKKCFEQNAFFLFSLQIGSENSIFQRIIHRYFIMNVNIYLLKFLLFFSECSRANFFSTIFERIRNIKYFEEPSILRPLVQFTWENIRTDEFTDIH